jgi:hypothetical protein
VIPITDDGKHYPARRALAQELAAISGRPVASIECLISTSKGDAETIHRRLFTCPAPPMAIPTTFDGRTFTSRRALIRHLAQQLGQPFGLIHAKYYALRGDADALVSRFTHKDGCAGNGSTSDGSAAQLTPLFNLLLAIGTALERLTAEVATTADERRRITERLDQLLRAQTETRRALGRVAVTAHPSSTARRRLEGRKAMIEGPRAEIRTLTQKIKDLEDELLQAEKNNDTLINEVRDQTLLAAQYAALIAMLDVGRSVRRNHQSLIPGTWACSASREM